MWFLWEQVLNSADLLDLSPKPVRDRGGQDGPGQGRTGWSHQHRCLELNAGSQWSCTGSGPARALQTPARPGPLQDWMWDISAVVPAAGRCPGSRDGDGDDSQMSGRGRSRRGHVCTTDGRTDERQSSRGKQQLANMTWGETHTAVYPEHTP